MCRAGEVLSLKLADVSLKDEVALVRHTKTRRDRIVAFGPATARSPDRYLRLRRSQAGADLPAFRLATRGARPLTYEALYATLRRRAERADPPFKLHPHVTWSTGAVRFRTREARSAPCSASPRRNRR